jgi:hypothetical protein
MSNQIKLRRGSSIYFSTTNPILSDGEPALEIDTGKIKYGDGTTGWNSLPYFSLPAANVSGLSAAAAAAAPVQSVNNKTGAVSLSLFLNDIPKSNFKDWQNITVPAPAGALYPIYANKKFYIFSRGSGGNPPLILDSVDGISWRTRSSPITNTAAIFSVAYGNGVFVLMGYTNESFLGLFTSTDGITWTQSNPPNYPSGLLLGRILPINASWSYPATIYSVVNFVNNRFIIIGFDTPQNVSNTAVSADGINWTVGPNSLPALNPSTGGNGAWVGLTYGNGLYVAVSAWTGSAKYATSTDGLNWTSRTLPPLLDGQGEEIFATQGAGNIAFGDGQFIIANNYGRDIVAKSVDGINWTKQTIPSSGANSIAYVDNCWFISGWDGRLFVSIDSVNWKTITHGIGNNFIRIAYGDGTLIMCHDSSGNNIIVNKDMVLSNTASLDRMSTIINHNNSGSSFTLSGTSTRQRCLLSSSCTFTMPPAATSLDFVLILTQTGSFTATFTNVRWPGNIAPTITTGANKIDIIRFISNGTNWYGHITQDYNI